ncbi:MAG: MFS transporter [Beijerinckiaceae bacterium]|nr:MFS transporter [Beijerinckiaceae bacterium]
MSEQAGEHDIDFGLLLPLLLHSFLVQALVPLVRVGTSYRAIELELPVIWIGIIAASFALLPVVFAIPFGRMIDRGHDSRAAQAGSLLMIAGCFILWRGADTQWHLLAANVVLGIGHILCMAGHQMITVRCAGPRSRESIFGYYMVALALGQAVGPFLIGLAAGNARVAPTDKVFFMAMIVVGLSGLSGFLLRAAPPKPPRSDTDRALGVMEILRLQGLTSVIFASVMTVTTLDLLVVYLPLLGTERHIEASHIGWLLTTRALASMASRLAYVQLFNLMGRVPLTVTMMSISTVGLFLLAAPVSLPWMYAAVVAVGYGLGIASTLTLSGIVEIAPVAARGTAMSLRLTGNRIGQVALPFTASLLAAATGVSGVFALTAVAVAAAGLAVQKTYPGR